MDMFPITWKGSSYFVSGIEGIEYYQLLNELETRLKKKIDLLRLETVIQNVKLMNEILKDGIKIYG